MSASVTEAVTPAVGEWIKWQGGNCPLPPGTLIQVQMRYETAFGKDESQPPRRAHAFNWRWDADEILDIVAYRVMPV